MLRMLQSGLSVIAGTAEPEYGREAIHTVTDLVVADSLPVYRETTVADFEWQKPGYTNVETQTFYFVDLKQNIQGFAQVIHSNVMGVHTTAAFTFKFFPIDKPEEQIWTQTTLENFRAEGPNFYADNLSIEISGDDTYTIKSHVNDDLIVELEVKRMTPGVIFGKDGMTLYGDDKANPWGSMRHLFWPRCSVKGTIKLAAKKQSWTIDGFTMFVMAIQGMKPHHAAKSWNFLNFQSENFAAVQMEFTTPRSYATTKINIGLITDNEKIITATINNEVVHKDPVVDEVGWPVPKEIEFKYLKDKKEETPAEDDVVIATCSGKLDSLVERVDVMAEIPQFVKNIVSGVAGAKPYIYQFCNEFEIDVDGKQEKGISFNEVTFISE